jgi:hypothetical protein
MAFTPIERKNPWEGATNQALPSFHTTLKKEGEAAWDKVSKPKKRKRKIRVKYFRMKASELIHEQLRKQYNVPRYGASP